MTLRTSRFTHGFAWVALFTLGACGGEQTMETVDREVFVQAYADLRISALMTDSQRVSMPARDSILETHGVTPEDLEVFAEVHSSDLDFMRGVWNEVELLLDKEQERIK